MADKALLSELETYVERHLIDNFLKTSGSLYTFAATNTQEPTPLTKQIIPNDFIEQLQDYIQMKKQEEKEVFHRADLNYKQYVKGLKRNNYFINKLSALALCFALELDQEETVTLLQSAGYSIDDDRYVLNLAIRFCLDKNIYALPKVNYLLDFLSISPLKAS